MDTIQITLRGCHQNYKRSNALGAAAAHRPRLARGSGRRGPLPRRASSRTRQVLPARHHGDWFVCG